MKQWAEEETVRWDREPEGSAGGEGQGCSRVTPVEATGRRTQIPHWKKKKEKGRIRHVWLNGLMEMRIESWFES